MSKKLFRLEITLPKHQTAFLYFILESLEGLVFYSTLEHQKGDMFRRMEIYCPGENFADFSPIMDELIPMLEIQVNSSPGL